MNYISKTAKDGSEIFYKKEKPDPNKIYMFYRVDKTIRDFTEEDHYHIGKPDIKYYMRKRETYDDIYHHIVDKTPLIERRTHA